jgi:phage-related minor tail protein
MKTDFSRWIRLDIDWDSSEWLHPLSAGARLAWIELLCHVKRSGIKGRVRIPSLKVLALQWNIPSAEIEEMLDAAADNDSVRFDSESWTITAWATFQNPEATRRQKWRELARTQEESDPVSRDSLGSVRESLSRDIDTDIDTDSDREKERRKEEREEGKEREENKILPLSSQDLTARAARPFNIHECLAFARRIGCSKRDGENFFHYYDCRGWLVGKGVPMVNWHSAMRLWRIRQEDTYERAQAPTPQPTLPLTTIVRRTHEELARLTA